MFAVTTNKDSGDETERTDDAAGDAPLPFDVRLEEIAHDGNLTQPICVASRTKLRQITDVDLMNQSFLWASLIWGAVGSGYLLYGWRQRAAIPFAGGAAITACSFFLPALPMTFASLVAMWLVYWLLKQGY